MLHAGGEGRSIGVGIIVNVEISKEVVRVERWQGRIIAVCMMIRQHVDVSSMMLCVAGDFNAHIGVVESVDEASIGRFGCGTMKGEDVEERVGGRGHVLPDGTRHSSPYRWCGSSSSGG